MATDHDTDDTTNGVSDSYPHVSTDCNFLAMLPRHVEIDPLGDKTLIVGTNQCSIDTSGAHEHKRAGSFRVCSRALARSSPVMKAMLFGKFQESRQDVIKLPEDDSDAMEILLHVIHNNPTPAFYVIDQYYASAIEQAYEIVVLANKYLMTQQLHRWAESWACVYTWPSWEGRGDDHAQTLREKQLFIAYEFGHARKYEELLAELALHHTRDQDQFSASIEPPGASERISSTREWHIDRMLHHLRSIMAGLSQDVDSVWNPGVGTVYYCNQDTFLARSQCETQTLGVLIRHLVSQRLWPLPDADDVDEDIRSLYLRIVPDGLWTTGGWTDSTEKPPPLFPGGESHPHAECNIRNRFEADFRDVMPEPPTELMGLWPSDEFVEYVLSRARQLKMSDEVTEHYENIQRNREEERVWESYRRDGLSLEDDS